MLAATTPVLVVPGMNDEMFAHAATQQNIQTLRERGWTVVGPAIGPLAEGPSDRPGRMVEPEEILAHVERALRAPGSPLSGRNVLVTAGATREHLDPVRVITNPASGRQGYALAEAAFARGAEVTLVSGPSTLPTPSGVELVRVETTEQLLSAVERLLPQADVLVMAVAPADFRPTEPGAAKRPRSEGPLSVTLEPTPDVLVRTLAKRRSGCVAVGFALETGDVIERARQKLEAKQLDFIVLNRADEPGSGFEEETNRVTLVSPDDERELPMQPKREVAEQVLDEVERRL